MQAITLQPIETPVELMCPHCDQPIYRVSKNKTEVIRGGYWLHGGDSIPGVYDALSEQQIALNNFTYLLLTGSQTCCQADYYVIEYQLVDGEVEGGYGDAVGFFEDYLDNPEAENFIASYEGSNQQIPWQWLVTQTSSPKGLIHCHLFGPFPVLKNISGSNGVIAHNGRVELDIWTHGRILLLTLWDDLRELVKQPVRI